MVRSLLLLAGLVALSYGLFCKTCSNYTIKITGSNSSDEYVSNECESKYCNSNENACSYGWATIDFKAPNLNEPETNDVLPSSSIEDINGVDDIKGEIVIDWMKGCAKSTEVQCEHVNDMMKTHEKLQGEISFSMPKCDMKYCIKDNCNDKTVAEIKEFSCYTCHKSTEDGKPDSGYPDQPECWKYKEKCDLGSNVCVEGNMAVTMIGDKKRKMEYFKGCGSNLVRDCVAFEEEIRQPCGTVDHRDCDVFEANWKINVSDSEVNQTKINSCSIIACEGNLCNTMTTHVLSCFLASVLIYFWVSV